MARNDVPFLVDTASREPVTLFKGNKKTLTFTQKDVNGVAIDISLKTATSYKLTAKQEFSDTANLWQLSGSFTTDGTDGKIDFDLTSTELATVVNDAVMEFTDENDPDPVTLGQFIYDVKESV